MTTPFKLFMFPTEQPRWADKKYDKLLDLREPDCKACQLYRSTTNVCVMGRGNLHAPIHLVGEAPGAAESETGLPFMGDAGQKVLNPILKELGMEPFVYISNVARCRPPKNRKPTPEEMNTCSTLYLEKEVAIIQPMIVVAMGKTAAEWAFSPLPLPPYGEITNQRHAPGQPAVMRTWHPAYCLPGRGGKLFANRFKTHLADALAYVREHS